MTSRAEALAGGEPIPPEPPAERGAGDRPPPPRGHPPLPPRRRRPTPIMALTCVTPPSIEEVRGRAALAILGPAPADVAPRVVMLSAGIALMVTALSAIPVGVLAGAVTGAGWAVGRRLRRSHRERAAEEALQAWLAQRPFPIAGLRAWLSATRPVIDVTLARALASTDVVVDAAHGHDPLIRVVVRRTTELRFALPQRWVITGRGRATPVADAEALWVFVERVLGPLHDAAGVSEVILRDGSR